jgi:hypothetical protein
MMSLIAGTEEKSEMSNRGGTDPNPRIRVLLRRIEESRSALAEERVREQKRAERENARLALIVGSVLVREGDDSPDFRDMLIRILRGSGINASDAAFLAKKGWPLNG